MRKYTARALTHIFLNIFIAIGLLFSVTYAWYVYFYDLATVEQRPGELNASFSFARYNKITEVWDNVSPDGDLVIDLGEMRNIATLPPNNEHYFKFKMSDTSSAQTLYNVIIQNVEITVENESGIVTVAGLDYYDASPSQNVFNFYFHMSTTDNSDPTVIFSDYENMPMNKVTAPNQGIFPTYTSLDNWTYVMIKPQLKQVQNIIRQVPIEHSPYTLVFNMTFAGEVRTVDE